MKNLNGKWKKAGMLSLVAVVAAGALVASGGVAMAKGGDDEHGQGNGKAAIQRLKDQVKQAKDELKDARKDVKQEAKDQRKEQQEARKEARKQHMPLVIAGPHKLKTGDTAAFKVIERKPNQPVAGAKVYALPGNRKNVLHGKEPNLQAVLDKDGTLLGTTDAQGMVSHAFTQQGGYVIVAIKDSHRPGTLNLKVADNVTEVLVMQSPAKAAVNAPVKVTVLQQNDHQPVAGVGVYAIKAGEKAAITYVQAPDAVTMQVKRSGKLLGTTGADGTLTFSIDTAGSYSLAGVKDGFRPTRRHIGITPVVTPSSSPTPTSTPTA